LTGAAVPYTAYLLFVNDIFCASQSVCTLTQTSLFYTILFDMFASSQHIEDV